MGLFDKLRRKNSTSNADPGEGANLIKVFDKSGRVILLPREDCRTKSLPAMLSANREDPDQLYTVIVQALNDGFFADVLGAAKHLYDIDPVRARDTCVYGIALMKNNQLEDAEHLFLLHIEKHGEDGAVLTNLAKVYAARNEANKAEACLWRALEVDPNQESAATWFAALGHERGGKKGMADSWRRIAQISGSWRAQLWLARTALESHNPQLALTLYRESLSRIGESTQPADVLTTDERRSRDTRSVSGTSGVVRTTFCP